MAARTLHRPRFVAHETERGRRFQAKKIGPSCGVSSFLFAWPSFLGGAASVMDLGGTLAEYNESPAPEVADALALHADWQAICADFWDVVDQDDEIPDYLRRRGRVPAGG